MSKIKFKKTPILMVTLIIVSSLCISVGYAWYAINKAVERTGISLNTTVTPNLVITESPANVSILDIDSAPFTVTRSYSNVNKYLPCTHLTTATNADTNLVYISNTGDIDPQTGLTPSGTYYYEDVTSGTGGNGGYFYIENKTYIAATDKEMTSTTLKASLTGEYKNLAGNVLPEGEDKAAGEYNYNTFRAASVDFYIDGTYKGTLNVAGKDANINNGAAKKTEVTLINNGTIPLNTASTNNYIEVTMRFYFDGALLMDASNAYVNTLSVTTEYAVLNIAFSAS